MKACLLQTSLCALITARHESYPAAREGEKDAWWGGVGGEEMTMQSLWEKKNACIRSKNTEEKVEHQGMKAEGLMMEEGLPGETLNMTVETW